MRGIYELTFITLLPKLALPRSEAKWIHPAKMNNDNLNNSFNENELLNDVNIDPALPIVPAGGNNEQGGPHNENGVIEQVSIQDLVQRINGLAQSLEDRANVLL